MEGTSPAREGTECQDSVSTLNPSRGFRAAEHAIYGEDGAATGTDGPLERMLADDLFIFAMRPDPEPDQSIGHFDRDCAVMRPNASRPEAPHLLEVD